MPGPAVLHGVGAADIVRKGLVEAVTQMAEAPFEDVAAAHGGELDAVLDACGGVIERIRGERTQAGVAQHIELRKAQKYRLRVPHRQPELRRDIDAAVARALVPVGAAETAAQLHQKRGREQMRVIDSEKRAADIAR